MEQELICQYSQGGGDEDDEIIAFSSDHGSDEDDEIEDFDEEEQTSLMQRLQLVAGGICFDYNYAYSY